MLFFFPKATLQLNISGFLSVQHRAESTVIVPSLSLLCQQEEWKKGAILRDLCTLCFHGRAVKLQASNTSFQSATKEM